MIERVEAVVVGAGVVGLAVARALAIAGREVLLLEAAGAIGTGVSSRNSEVIHAGIYYPTGSLKARLCVAGRRALYGYCAEHGVATRRVGKLIVATTPSEMPALTAIQAAASANGVTLDWLDADAAHAMEPPLQVAAALLSPETGIIDSHGLMLALLGDAQAAGAMLALNTPAVGGVAIDGGIRLQAGGIELQCEVLINAAGLGAPALARSLGARPASVPDGWLCKGSYFTLAGPAPFGRLIYPVPEPGGLGVHLTFDLAGRARFGPDVQWVEREDYTVDPARMAGFTAAIRRYWPGLPEGALQPDYAGIRPKITPRGAPAADFTIAVSAAHGVPGLVNLLGIESPGLTASLAIADLVASLV